MFRRFFAALVMAVALVMTTSVASFSQTFNFDSVVSFGDSLSDNGNAFLISGGIIPPSPPYAGRFSNGPTWVELLNGPMDNNGAFMFAVPPGTTFAPITATTGTGNFNFAIGGARSDAVLPLQNIAGIASGVPNQIAAYAAGPGAGGVPANTLFTVLAGANDVFDFFQTNPAPSQALVAGTGIAIGTNVVTDVGQLLGVGAQTILVSNIPNLGATPAFSGNATTAGGGALITANINGAIKQGLQTLATANPTANIVELDLAGLFNTVLARPGAFGLTNVSQPCVVFTGVVLTSLCTNPEQFLFWDSVHPTAVGHAFIAQFAALTLGFDQGAEAVAAFDEVGTWARLNATDAVFDRAMSWLHGTYAQQNGLYAEVIGIDGDIDRSGNRASYDYGLYGVRGGLDKQIGNFLIGGSGAFLAGDLNAPAIDSELIIGQADLYASAYMAPFFATGEIGAAVSALNDIKRNLGLAGLKAEGETDGYQYGAAAEAGALLQMGNISIIPAARIEYLGGHIAGYTEEAPILAKSFKGRDTDAVLASGRLRVAAMLAPAGIPTSVFGEVGYEDFVSYDEDNVVVSLFNNTALPVAIAVDDPDARGLYFKAGMNGKLNDAVAIDFTYGYSSHNGDGDIHSGKLRVKIRN